MPALPAPLRTALAGAASGVAGVAVMTLGELVEQRVTHRPSSMVPGRTLAHVLHLPDPDRDSAARMWAMHVGTAASVGVLRGAMARANLRGPVASALHTAVRLAIDQTLENGTGVGAPPASWPRDELAVDLLHKAVYAFATGVVADRLVAPRPGSSAGRPAQGARLAGFA